MHLNIPCCIWAVDCKLKRHIFQNINFLYTQHEIYSYAPEINCILFLPFRGREGGTKKEEAYGISMDMTGV